MSNKGIMAWVVGVIVALFVAAGMLGSFYTVDEGERGVELRNGKILGVSEPGLGFKVPFIDEVKRVSVQTFTVSYNNLAAYSRDQQPAVIRASVTYRVPVDQVVALYSQFGDIERMQARLIDRQISNQIENVFGQYTAISVVQKRTQFVKDINDAVKLSVIGPVMIDSVQIENIDFSEAYEQSVEARMKAEVGVETARQNLLKEEVNARIAVTTAQGVADSRVAQAKADAEAIKLLGNAEADAIRERAAALSQNQNLVELVRAERWNGVLPTHVLPNQTVPFLNSGK